MKDRGFIALRRMAREPSSLRQTKDTSGRRVVNECSLIECRPDISQRRGARVADGLDDRDRPGGEYPGSFGLNSAAKCASCRDVGGIAQPEACSFLARECRFGALGDQPALLLRQ